MHDAPDMDLLQQYAHRNSDEAFATLVQRHVNLVYSTALRKTGNPHAAEEITQAVFIILAKKAGSLRDGTILSGWLYQTARFTAASFLRNEIRRAHREQEAYMQSLSNETEPNVWLQIAPHLEDAMGQLGEKDRNAIALRFFEGKSFQEVGNAFGASENAAKKRVAYALEKLRKYFLKRGIVSTTAIIAGVVSANSVQAAPVALATSISAVAITKGAAVSGSTLTLIKGALKIMAWTKAKMAIVVASGLILAVGISVVVVEKTSLVQGKTESEWIKSIVYFGDSNQTKLWNSLGSRGVQMLVRALKSPPNDRDTRMRAASLLSQLGNDAKSAIPELISLLKTEKDDSVRAIELGYFEGPIESMEEKEKAALFPELLRAMQSEDSSVRNNALVLLQFYPSQTNAVVPLMVKSLQDSNPQVRLMAVKALNKVDPQNPAMIELK